MNLLASAATIVLSAIVVLNWWQLALHSPQTGWDFPVFYIAARLPFPALYNPDAYRIYWVQHLQGEGVRHWAPFVRLPLFVLPLRLLLCLSYKPSLWCWLIGNVLAYLAAIGLLLWKLRLPFPLLPALLLFFPAMAGILSGADIGLYFLVLTLAFILLEQRSSWAAGLCLTLCLAKYNLLLLVPVMLLLRNQARVLVGFCAGTLLVCSLSLALCSLGAYTRVLTLAPTIAHHFSAVGLAAFSKTVGLPEAYLPGAMCILAICCWIFRYSDFRTAFATAITGALLLSPYVTWYDSTLLVLPLLCLFAEAGWKTRTVCMLVLLAIPLWIFGGGFNGQFGFAHIAVEVSLLSCCARKAGEAFMVKRCGGRTFGAVTREVHAPVSTQG